MILHTILSIVKVIIYSKLIKTKNEFFITYIVQEKISGLVILSYKTYFSLKFTRYYSQRCTNNVKIHF